MARAFYLVSYDISDDRLRTRVAHLLEGYGQRVQYSVFEIWLSHEEHQALQSRLASMVKQEGSVRIYALCAACCERIEILGEGEPTDELDLLIL